MNFEDLSPQILIPILVSLEITKIEELCALSPILSQKICGNDDFWRLKYIRTFGIPEKTPTIWREAYHQIANLRVLGFGTNLNGELGIEGEKIIYDPRIIPGLIGIQSVSAGNHFSLVLSNENKVSAFGSNNRGQLGVGDEFDRNIPTPIGPLLRFGVVEGQIFNIEIFEKIIAISTGRAHSLFLTEEGHVFSSGHNLSGQLGFQAQENKNDPYLIPRLRNIKSISAGNLHSLVLTQNGQVYGFGYNHFGQLGLGDHQSRYTPTLIPNLNNIQAISAGAFHSLVLDNNGNVYAFGNGVHSQLGLGDNRNQLIPILLTLDKPIKAISAGTKHNLLLTQDNQVYAFGSNDKGQLGLGNRVDQNIPKLIPNLTGIQKIFASDDYSLLLNEEGLILGTGTEHLNLLYSGLGGGIPDINFMRRNKTIPVIIPHLYNVYDISAGKNHILILFGPMALFSTIETLIEKELIVSWGKIRSTSGQNSLFKFIDINGYIYYTEIYYDAATNQIYPPI